MGTQNNCTTPPKEPVLMCRSNNYPNGFYCSWHLPSPTYIPDTFNITVKHDSKEIVCEKDASPKNRCYIRYLHLFSTKKYKVTLTVTNALGRNSTTISFDEFAIGRRGDFPQFSAEEDSVQLRGPVMYRRRLTRHRKLNAFVLE
uniref:Uncharacterized protein n=1 Tax=Sphaerodactylus townsendi TaxID=933632 RepID=A0ACB8ENV3_9SAUR